MRTIYVTGNIPNYTDLYDAINEQDISNCYLFTAGNLGLTTTGAALHAIDNLDWICNKRNIMLVAARGAIDDPQFYISIDSKVKMRGNVILLQDYTVFKNTLFIGGGIPKDYLVRRPGVNTFTWKPCKGIGTLVKSPIKRVISYATPYSAIKKPLEQIPKWCWNDMELAESVNTLTEYMDDIADKILIEHFSSYNTNMEWFSNMLDVHQLEDHFFKYQKIKKYEFKRAED